MSRIIAIDYGKKRTGIAVSDTLQMIANGLTTVPTHELLAFIMDYVAKEPVERKRGNKIRVKYLDEDLVEHDEIVEGYLARVMQHEFDHLDGKMFIDHLSPLRRQMIKGKLNAMLKGKAHCTYKVKTVK